MKATATDRIGDITTRLNRDMTLTLRRLGVRGSDGLVPELVEDALFHVERLLVEIDVLESTVRALTHQTPGPGACQHHTEEAQDAPRDVSD